MDSAWTDIDALKQEIQRLRRDVSDMRYDLRKELLEHAQIAREELYDVRIRMMRLEEKSR